MMKQTETQEKKYVPTAQDNFDDLMILKENTFQALNSLFEVVSKIKKDLYTSENDELDEELKYAEEAIEAIAEIV